MYHTGTNGTHTITLPDNVVKVRELFTGTEYNSNVITLQSDGPNTWLFRAATGGIWPVGDDVIAALDADGTLSIDGTGAMDDFATAADLPWDPSAVKSVTIGDGVVVGENALAGLPDSATVNGMNVGQYRKLFGGLGMSGVPEGSVVVSRTELEAARAATLEIADGTAILGISVCTNGDLTAATSSWAPVAFRKSDLEVSADGTKIIAPIPANAEKGFMILRSGN